MAYETKNISKLLHFTEALCEFSDAVSVYHACYFDIKIGDNRFKFDLPELVAEIRKYRQAVIDDTENLSDDE